MNTALSKMRLETERLIIRPYVESDLMESFELMQDPELFTYLHFGVMSQESYQKLFSWLINSYQTPFDASFKYSFAIFKKETGAFIGWCGVGVLDFMSPEKELFYLIGRNDWGKGYATEAALQYAQGCLPFRYSRSSLAISTSLLIVFQLRTVTGFPSFCKWTESLASRTL